MRCHTTFAFEWSFLGELRGELLGLKCAPWDLGVWSDSHLRSEGVLPRKDTMFSSMEMRCRLLCRSRSCLSTFWHERPCVVLRRFDQGDVIFGAQDIYDTELYAKRWTRDQPPEPSEWLAACARCIFVGGGFLRNVQASRGVALIIL